MRTRFLPQTCGIGVLLLGSSFLLVAAAIAGCQTRKFDAKTASDQVFDPTATDPCRNTGKPRANGKMKELSPLIEPHIAMDALKRAQQDQTPWVDWQYLRGVNGQKETDALIDKMAASENPFVKFFGDRLQRAKGSKEALWNEAGVIVALLQLENQRTDLLSCSMWDTNGTIDSYVPGNLNANRDPGRWDSLQFDARPDIVTARGGRDTCSTDDNRFRTLDGTCNDPNNPLMGARLMRFPRNVSFEAVRKPTGDEPDPAEISKRLLQRPAASSTDAAAMMEYRQAPFFNLIAASWIQFMTHDWFSHARKGKNDDSRALDIGNGQSAPATLPDPSDKTLAPVSKNRGAPGVGTFVNQVTFWWDASQIYGWDDATASRVRDPQDRAKLRLTSDGMLPIMGETLDESALDDLHPHERGQGLAAFSDNWWIGIAMLHTAFAREHNRFVELLKTKERRLSPEERFQIGRLYVAALIAKIHTIEWTPQLLFNPVLESAMESNWHGIIGNRLGDPRTKRVQELRESVARLVNRFNDDATQKSGIFGNTAQFTNLLKDNNFLFAFLAAGPGITALNANQFGSPFALPEEFTTVYRLHPLIPDVLQKRNVQDGRLVSSFSEFEAVRTEDTVLSLSESQLKADTIADWWASFGIQPTGTLQLNNYPRFMNRLFVAQNNPGQQNIDLAALEIMRDRERGVPKLNEFRANLGLKPLRDFDDFIDMEKGFTVFTKCAGKPYTKYKEFKNELKASIVGSISCGTAELEGARQALLKQISERDTLIDVYKDINAVDTLVGFLAENTRPHGYALAETQFQVFILNASRRLFSDHFFSEEKFNEKFYTKFGMEELRKRGMRDVLADNFKEEGLDRLLRTRDGKMYKIANAFDPWTRPRRGFEIAEPSQDTYDAANLQGGSFD